MINYALRVILSTIFVAVSFCAWPALSAQADSRVNEWPLDAQHLRAERTWKESQGAGVIVAVVDSGCDGRHPDLVGQLVPGAGFIGVPGDDGRVDDSGDSHGTSIAAIIAGTGRNPAGNGIVGLAPKAKILSVRISADARIEPVALAKGIIYAADRGARIINVSAVTPEPDPNIRAAVEHAERRGAVVVAAAGNTAQTGSSVGYPASFPGVVAVSAVDADKRFWNGSASGPQVVLAAPGVDIRSANDQGGYQHGDGTSLAVPYVTAAAALLWSKYPNLTAGQVIRQLVDTADSGHSGQRDDQIGFGVVDPLRALTEPMTSGSGLPAAGMEPGSGIAWWWYAGGVGFAISVLVSIGAVMQRRRSAGN